MLDKEEKLFNREGKSFILTNHVKGNEIKQWVNEYKKNEQFRAHKRKNQNYLTHEIISFHDAENLSLEQLEDIAGEYIRLRNPKGMYVAVPHFDKHYHIHICCSSIEYRTGQSMRMSKGQFKELKVNIQQYQQEKYPGLSKSIVKHGKGKTPSLSDKEFQFKLRTGRKSQKEKLVGILNDCYKKAKSKESFFELVQGCGIKIYSRGGKISGVYFTSKKFRLKRIGFNEERLNELDKSINRSKELQKVREKGNEKTLKREITK